VLSCFLSRRRISAFLDGELSGARARTVSRHLSGCGGCRRQADQLERLRAMLGAERVVRQPDWSGFWPGVVRGIEAARSGPAGAVPSFPRRRVVLAGMGALTGGLLAFGVWTLSNPPVPLHGAHLVELADTEYPEGVMVYSPPESDMTVIWVFSPEGVAGSAI
jgi:anti-sigma factor RsiW